MHEFQWQPSGFSQSLDALIRPQFERIGVPYSDVLFGLTFYFPFCFALVYLLFGALYWIGEVVASTMFSACSTQSFLRAWSGPCCCATELPASSRALLVARRFSRYMRRALLALSWACFNLAMYSLSALGEAPIPAAVNALLLVLCNLVFFFAILLASDSALGSAGPQSSYTPLASHDELDEVSEDEEVTPRWKLLGRRLVRAPRRRPYLASILAFLFLVASIAPPLVTEGTCPTYFPTSFSSAFGRSRSARACSGGTPCNVFVTLGNTRGTLVCNWSVEGPPQAQALQVDGGAQVDAQRLRVDAGGETRTLYWAPFSVTRRSTVFRVGNPISGVFSGERRVRGFSSNYTFISGGDMGVNPTARQMLVLAAAAEPAFIALGGDLAYDNGLECGYHIWDSWLAQYIETAQTPSGHMIPLVAALGSSDSGGYKREGGTRLRADPWYIRLLVQDESLKSGDLQASTHSHELPGGDILVILDTCFFEQVDVQAATLRELATRTRAEHPSARIFLMYHDAIYPFHGHNGTITQTLAEAWLPVFDEFGVSVAFENHERAWKRTPLMHGGSAVTSSDGLVQCDASCRAKRPTLFIGDGCMGATPSNRLHVKSKVIGDNWMRRMNYQQVSITPEEVTIISCDEMGDPFDNVTLPRFF